MLTPWKMSEDDILGGGLTYILCFALWAVLSLITFGALAVIDDTALHATYYVPGIVKEHHTIQYSYNSQGAIVLYPIEHHITVFLPESNLQLEMLGNAEAETQIQVGCAKTRIWGRIAIIDWKLPPKPEKDF